MGNNPLIGRVLGKRYQLVRLIGRGGMGEVYEGVHCNLGKQVAVKMLSSANPSLSDEAIRRFCREAKAASQLRHPHIIEVTDYDLTDGGTPYMVMEYLEGQDLRQLLDHQRRLAADRVWAIMRPVFSAMEAAHRGGIVHRDLKPPNIFLCRFGDDNEFPKVLDFGVSKVLDATSELTRGDSTMGTPRYMAPEQAKGRSGEADARSDIFALGAMVYRMFGGEDAFGGDSPLSVLFKVVNEEPRPLEQLCPDLPRAAANVVRRAMEKGPNQRFQSAAEMSAALGQALGFPDQANVSTMRDSRVGVRELGAPEPRTDAEAATFRADQVQALVDDAPAPAGSGTTLGGAAGQRLNGPVPSGRMNARRVLLGVAAGLLLIAGGAALQSLRVQGGSTGLPYQGAISPGPAASRPDAAALLQPASAPDATAAPPDADKDKAQPDTPPRQTRHHRCFAPPRPHHLRSHRSGGQPGDRRCVS